MSTHVVGTIPETHSLDSRNNISLSPLTFNCLPFHARCLIPPDLSQDYTPTVFDNYVVTLKIGDEAYTLGT